MTSEHKTIEDYRVLLIFTEKCGVKVTVSSHDEKTVVTLLKPSEDVKKENEFFANFYSVGEALAWMKGYCFAKRIEVEW